MCHCGTPVEEPACKCGLLRMQRRDALPTQVSNADSVGHQAASLDKNWRCCLLVPASVEPVDEDQGSATWKASVPDAFRDAIPASSGDHDHAGRRVLTAAFQHVVRPTRRCIRLLGVHLR